MPSIKEHYLRYEFLRPIAKKDKGDGVTYDQLERTVTKLFNENLKYFPPGVGPRDLIEEYIKKGYIIEIKQSSRHFPRYKVKNFWEEYESPKNQKDKDFISKVAELAKELPEWKKQAGFHTFHKDRQSRPKKK